MSLRNILGNYLPIIISLIIFFSSIAFLIADVHIERGHLIENTQDNLEHFSRDLDKSILDKIELVDTLLVDQWTSVGNESQLVNYQRYLQIIPAYFNYSGSFLALNWINNGGIIEWVYPYDRNKNAIGMNVTYYSSGSGGLNDAFALAKNNQTIGITRYSEFYQGGGGFVAYIPIMYNSSLYGYFNLVFEFHTVLNDLISQNDILNDYCIRIEENQTVVIQTNEEFENDDDYVVHHRMQFYYRNLDIYFRPVESEIRGVSFISTIPVIISIVLLCLITYILANQLTIKNRIIRDEYEEKGRMQELIFQSRKMKALGRVSGGVAHDFNNIMQNIQGHIEILTKLSLPKLKTSNLELDVINEIEDSLSSITKNLKRSKEITHQILTFSKQRSFEYKLIDGGKIIAESVKLVEETANDEIIFDYQDTSFVLYSSDTILMQIMMNLLINAVEAIEHNHGKIDISSQIKPTPWIEEYYEELERKFSGEKMNRDEVVVISVKDNGKGISYENQISAFDPFFTTKKSGTGLGLGIVHQNVDAMGGKIELNSQIEKGAEFLITLPLPLNQQLQAEQKREFTDLNVLSNTSVLIVDDEEDILQALKTLLSKFGMLVQLSSDGENAWSLLQDKNFDLIIIDINLPGLNGIELYRRILNKGVDQRVIFITGYSDEKLDFEGINLLEKPIDVDTLIQMILRELTQK
ncbi:MAG: response regulator [Candidatus Heimdallarchaeota archaeon]|nr:response regulator [Candidatus Heimdallarchaeota archaeon]